MRLLTRRCAACGAAAAAAQCGARAPVLGARTGRRAAQRAAPFAGHRRRAVPVRGPTSHRVIENAMTDDYQSPPPALIVPGPGKPDLVFEDWLYVGTCVQAWLRAGVRACRSARPTDQLPARGEPRDSRRVGNHARRRRRAGRVRDARGVARAGVVSVRLARVSEARAVGATRQEEGAVPRRRAVHCARTSAVRRARRCGASDAIDGALLRTKQPMCDFGRTEISGTSCASRVSGLRDAPPGAQRFSTTCSASLRRRNARSEK